MGIEGEILCQNHGAENTKKRTPGIATNNPVTMLIGFSRVFWNRPPNQNTVLPVKYWWLAPSVCFGAGLGASIGVKPGEDATEDNFSLPCVLRLGLCGAASPLVGNRKLERKERGDLDGVGNPPPFL
jgi:hypothetical protein